MKRVKSLSEIWAEIKSGNPFDVEYCKYDEKRQTGGERAELKQVRLVMGEGDREYEVTVRERKEPMLDQVKRNPNHYMHGTFNVRLVNGEIRKIHRILLERINGYQIVL